MFVDVCYQLYTFILLSNCSVAFRMNHWLLDLTKKKNFKNKILLGSPIPIIGDSLAEQFNVSVKMRRHFEIHRKCKEEGSIVKSRNGYLIIQNCQWKGFDDILLSQLPNCPSPYCCWKPYQALYKRHYRMYVLRKSCTPFLCEITQSRFEPGAWRRTWREGYFNFSYKMFTSNWCLSISRLLSRKFTSLQAITDWNI